MKDYQEYNQILYSHLSGSFCYCTFTNSIPYQHELDARTEERHQKLLRDFELYIQRNK